MTSNQPFKCRGKTSYIKECGPVPERDGLCACGCQSDNVYCIEESPSPYDAGQGGAKVLNKKRIR